MKLTRFRKLAYGMGDTPLSLFFTVLSFYFLYFLTDIVGILPAVAGWIYSAGRVWDAFSDPMMGFLSDRTRSPWGRRRPYLLFGAPVLGLSFCLLWQTWPVASPLLESGLYALTALIFFSAFTVVSIPFSSLAVELTADYDERTGLLSYRMAFSLLMGIAAAALPGLFLNGPGGASAGSFSRMGLWLGGLGFLPMIVTFAFTREKYQERTSGGGSLVASCREVWKNKGFRVTLGVYLFSWVPMDIVGAVLIYYLQYVLHRQAILNALLLEIFGTAALCLPLWNLISRRLEKRTASMIGGSVAAFSLFALFFLPASTPVWVLFLVGIPAGFGFSAAHLFPWALLPECIDQDAVSSGQRREGMFTGFFSLSQKIASSVSVALIGTLLSLTGYVPGAEQAPRALMTIRALAGIVPGVIFLFSVLVVSRYPISREDYRNIREILEKEGEESPVSGAAPAT